jgi:hypothetical protein
MIEALELLAPDRVEAAMIERLFDLRKVPNS